MSDIKISNLDKFYSNVHVLKDINLDIKSGEFIVFVGPSGCGKSTLLRTISGLETISAGTLEIDGEIVNDVAPSRRGIAMVFQSYALYPHMNVFDNLAYGLKIAKHSRAEIREKVTAVADKLQLTDYLKRLPRALSGGQRQRVAIGRAIVRDPKVFLFDEPLSNLDAALRVKMRMEISGLRDQLPGTTMIYVTHDQVEAMTMADRIVVLKGGVVQQVGTPMALYENPANLFVAGFIGSPRMNLLSGAHAERFGCATLGIRSEHLDIVDGDGDFAGRVKHTEILGSDTYIYLDIGGPELFVVRQEGNCAVAAHADLAVKARAGRLHRFDDTGRPLGAADHKPIS